MAPRTLSLTATLLVLSACGRAEPPRTDQAAAAGQATVAPAVVAAPAQDTGFAGTTAPLDRPPFRRGARPVILSAVSASPHAGYDRIVFEFTGDSVPGYLVEYPSRPVVRCGSGDPVTVLGAAPLRVRLEPARAHDEQGQSSVAQREWAPALAAVKELKLVCDFEAQVEWVVGVAAPGPYRVTVATAPARIVVDVRHAP